MPGIQQESQRLQSCWPLCQDPPSHNLSALNRWPFQQLHLLQLQQPRQGPFFRSSPSSDSNWHMAPLLTRPSLPLYPAASSFPVPASDHKPFKKGIKTQAFSAGEYQVLHPMLNDTPQGPLCRCLGLPVLVLNHSVYDLLHLLGKVRWVWGQLLGRWPSTLLLLLALLVLVTAAGAGGRGGGAGLAVPLALA